jgi:hypothetical protein
MPALVLGCWFPAAALAQAAPQFQSGFYGGALTGSGGGGAAVFTMAPELRLDGDRLGLDLTALGASIPGSALRLGGIVTGTARQPIGSRLWLDAEGMVGREPRLLSDVSTAAAGRLRLSLLAGSGGVWAAAGVRREAAVGPWLAPDLSRGLSAGLWRRIGPVELSGELHGVQQPVSGWHYFTRLVPDSALGDSVMRFRDSTFSRGTGNALGGEIGLRWAPGRFSFDLSAGHALSRLPGLPAVWYRLSGEMALSRRLSLVVGASRLPQTVDPQAPGGRLVVGFRYAARARAPAAPALSPSASAPDWFAMADLGGSWRRIRIRVPDARRVELLGDFTDWIAVPLTPVNGAAWEIELEIPPGTYHLNLRIDGEPPVVPPGLPAVADEFQGRVGLLVVE